MSFLGVDFSAILARTHGARVDDISLVKVTAGALDANPTAGRTVSSVSYPARGYLDDYDEHQISGTLVEEGDVRVVIFAGTLADGVAPSVRDRISRGNDVYVLVGVRKDPSGARYVCQARSGGVVATDAIGAADIYASATAAATGAYG